MVHASIILRPHAMFVHGKMPATNIMHRLVGHTSGHGGGGQESQGPKQTTWLS